MANARIPVAGTTGTTQGYLDADLATNSDNEPVAQLRVLATSAPVGATNVRIPLPGNAGDPQLYLDGALTTNSDAQAVVQLRVQSAIVEAVDVLIDFDDPDLLTGKVVYQARAGDIISPQSFLATYQAFDGDSPTLHLLLQGEVPNTDDLMRVVAISSDPPYLDSAGLRAFFVGAGELPAAYYFQQAAALIALLDDGNGGDPSSTQGRAEMRLLIVHRATTQPLRPSYAVVAADSSLQYFEIAGNHVYDFTLGSPSAGANFGVTGSTANDGPYTAYDGGQRNISAINQGTQTITLGSLSHTTLRLPPGAHFTIATSTGNDGVYTVATATDLGATITTVEPLPSAVADGHVLLPAAVYLSGVSKTLIWVLGSTMADSTGDGTISL